MGKYDKILNMEYPFPSKHIPMSLNNRAKIFLPFAALKGYEELIAQKQQIKAEKIELCQDAKEELDEKLNYLIDHLPMQVAIDYFDDKMLQISGLCNHIDISKNQMIIDDTVISLQSIIQIQL